ncbi:MAG TPA: TetR/AcrR family transcriptional regulator [Pyrinomonadaceae bacterium]|nr:TetR/AcrR family transcriptional regulator [Pyrinomonadaceae bacterium]
MKVEDRRVRRTRKTLHDALISLVLEGNYDAITIQQIVDRANVGRSTFYTHFQSKDELLVSETEHLRSTLASVQQREKISARPRESILGFSRAMFEHADGYRNVYRALLNTQAWPIVRQRIHNILAELIRKECKSEIAKIRGANSDVPIELFVHFLAASFMTVLTWWLERNSRLSAQQINEVFRSLVLPSVDATLSGR